jgi:hypothetical protein
MKMFLKRLICRIWGHRLGIKRSWDVLDDEGFGMMGYPRLSDARAYAQMAAAPMRIIRHDTRVCKRCGKPQKDW